MKMAVPIALLVAGLVSIYFGYNESQALGSKLNEAMSGSPTDRSMLMMGGGAIATALGAFQLFKTLK